jgi:hypothetical protein
MKTTFLLQQHRRCEEILEMMQKCEGRIEYFRKRYSSIEDNPFQERNKEILLNRWARTIAIKERLAKSYANQLAKIIKPTIDKIIAPAVTEA